MLKAVTGLAVVMIAAGGTTIVNGWSMVLNERGWSQVIAGSVVLSAGLLILAMAGLVAHFKAVLAAQRDGAVPVDRRMTDASASGARADHPVERAVPAVPGHAEGLVSFQDTTGLDTAGMDTAGLDTAGLPRDVYPVPHEASPVIHGAASSRDDSHHLPDEPKRADADILDPFARSTKALRASDPGRARRESERSAHDLLAELAPQPQPMPVAKPDQWATGGDAGSWQESPQASSPPVQPSLLDRLAQEIEQPPAFSSYDSRRPIMPAVPPPPAADRVLVASYTAGGVGYFMYSDQTIEAEMAIGRYRFASMDELRHFVETNEGGIKIGEATQI